MPNGYSVNQNAYGHTSQSNPGDGNVNAYGNDFQTASLTWTRWFCTRDSDGDGRTNGFELGDPCCTWVRGGGSPAYTNDIGNPGDASVYPMTRNCSLATCMNGVDPCVPTSTGGAGSLHVAAWALGAVAAAAVASALAGPAREADGDE